MLIIYRCRNCGEQVIKEDKSITSLEDANLKMRGLISSGSTLVVHGCPPSVSAIGLADLIAIKPL